MHSKIAEAIKMKYQPVGLLWSDTKPENAIEMAEGKWGCAMMLVANAAKGKISAASYETMGCSGGRLGLGLSESTDSIPGGMEKFLSNGNPDLCNSEAGKSIAERNPDLLYGERYIKNEELAAKFIAEMPKRAIDKKYVIFKPLTLLEDNEIPISVIFLVNPDQLSGLVFLANYAEEGTNNAIIPMGAGCHQIGILAYKEAESENMHAIVGLTDPSARTITNKILGKDTMSFTVPYKMYLSMEAETDNSFLRRKTWIELMK